MGMRKFLQKFLPHHDTVKSHRMLRPFAGWLHHPNLWHLHRRSAAGGVAIGLFCGLVPGPLQMLSAALFAIVLRVNLPLAVFTTLYTNPFTIVPLYFLAYQLGAWVSGAEDKLTLAQLALPEMHWYDWWSTLWDWLVKLGEPFLIGLPLLAALLALVGYALMRLLWRGVVVWKWRSRQKRRMAR